MLDALAQRYNVRPSTLAQIVDPYAALCFDEAAAIVGTDADRQLLDAPDDDPRQPLRPRPPVGGGPARIAPVGQGGEMALFGRVPFTGPRPAFMPDDE